MPSASSTSSRRRRFGGNPLAVFEDARGIDDTTMQALALQFNLSETTFVLPSTRATAHVRIFTPTFEMPFAGHPTLGTAHVVRAVQERRRSRDAGDDRGRHSRGCARRHLDARGQSAEDAGGRGEPQGPRLDAGAGRGRRRARSRDASALGRHRLRAADDSPRLRRRRSPRRAARRSAARPRPHRTARHGLRLRAGGRRRDGRRRSGDGRPVLLPEVRRGRRGSGHRAPPAPIWAAG